MKIVNLLLLAAWSGLAVSCRDRAPRTAAKFNTANTNGHIFMVKGVVKELKPDGRTAVIKHEAISNYMDAMTMPFKVKEPTELSGLQPGDEISFRLLVSGEESWIDHVSKTGKALPVESKLTVTPPGAVQSSQNGHPLMDYKFTNELGQAVSLSQFNGQALAITFFFTRCPIPDYCPRLSKNFEEASKKLSAMPDAPTNWHFLSVTFDTEFDTPAVLKAYGRTYHYDSNHWSFLTGSADKIAELAGQSDVNFERAGGLFNHSFRTLIIDAAGRLQMSFPIGGNLSDAIVGEILKAAATNKQGGGL